MMVSGFLLFNLWSCVHFGDKTLVFNGLWI